VILNLILAAAMNTLPDSILYKRGPSGDLIHTGDMLKVIAIQYVGPIFAGISSIVFAVLLLSAVNTALADLVSIQFMLSRDKELPPGFSGLNRFGMPALPLVVGTVIPAVVVLIFPNVEQLAGLYAIGVVGAISINLGTTSTNRELPLRRAERVFMRILTVIMIAIGLTICLVKPHARSFALLVLVTGLAARLSTIVTNRVVQIPRSRRNAYLAFAVVSVLIELALAVTVGDSPQILAQHTIGGIGTLTFREADAGFLLMLGVAFIVGVANFRCHTYREQILAVELVAVPPTAPKRPLMIQPGAYTPRERIMVATQGNPRLIEFALKECKNRQAELNLLFVRHLAVTPMGPTVFPKLEEDEQALALFERLRTMASEAGVPLRLLYGVARDIPDAILDMAVTHGADLLLLGTTRRGALWKAMKGDVIQAVAEQLPESVDLLIHA
jgi:nucleotide-binding universal stress UspA family protein